MPKQFSDKEIAQILFDAFSSWGTVDPQYFDPKIKPRELGDMKGLNLVVRDIRKTINKEVEEYE